MFDSIKKAIGIKSPVEAAKIKLERDKYNTQSLVYPSDISNWGSGHYVMINVNVVKGSKFAQAQSQTIENPTSIPKMYQGSANTTRSQNGSGAYKRIDKVITLYMPESVTETLSNGWDGVEMGTLSRMINTGGSAIDGDLDRAANDVVEGMKNTIAGIVEYATPVNAKSLKNIQDSQLTNPFMEMSFSGTQNRQFSFEFKFMPKNEDESKNVKEIIKTLRLHSLPELKNGGKNYLLFPSTFDISFMFRNMKEEGSTLTKHPFLPQISTCALVDISTNYSGSGTFSTLKDGTPAEIIVTLQFTEIEQLTKNRVEEGY